jgi:hypothetical protein
LYVFALCLYILFMDTRARFNQQDSAHLWYVEAFGGLELFRACFARFTFSPHTHQEFMIAVNESGTALPLFRGGVHQVGPGDLFVLNPEEVHGGGPAEDSVWCYRSFYPPAALMQRVVQELPGLTEYPAVRRGCDP